MTLMAQDNGHQPPPPGRARFRSVVFTALAALAGMAVFEAAQHLLLPDISFVQSHAATVVFSALVAGGASWWGLKRYRVLQRQCRDELDRRREVERELRDHRSRLEELAVERNAELSRANEQLRREAGDRLVTLEALRLSDERFREMAENIGEVFWMSDPGLAEIIYVNPAFEKIWGVPCEALYRDSGLFLSTLHPDDRQRMAACIGNAAAAGFDEEFRIVRGDGALRWIRNHAFPVRNSAGTVYRLVGIAADITDRVSAIEELRAGEERYRRLYHNTPVMLHSIDRTGRLVSVSLYWLKVLGYSQEEVIGRRLTDFMTEPSRRYAEGTVLPMFMATGSCSDIEYQFVTKGGAVVEVLLSAVAERDAANAMVRSLAVLIDVTRRNRIEAEKAALEAQLIQSQKMEAVGQLAGGIAHDFNNILTAIISYGGLLELKMPADDPLRRYVSGIISAAEKAAHLTQGLLAFSRQQIIDPRPTTVNGLVKGAEKLVARIIREDIALATRPADVDITVMADPVQFEQALLNLAANARDAMPRGGSLTITVSRASLDEGFIKEHGFGRPGDYALISVADTGAGMDEKTKARIFEPFFTTKEVGKGTGLGLAMVYGIVKQHDGYITVQSAPGSGTVFSIYLPVVDIPTAAAAPAAAPLLPGNRELVLLAEDNTEVRQSTKEILEQFGYHVVEAFDGEDALHRFEEQAERVKLLVLDVIMPRMNGKEAYDAIRRRAPHVKALFMSGYTDDIIHKSGLLEQGLTFISKPVSPGELLRTMRELLDR